MEQAITLLDRAKYLFLTSISEPQDNSLRIVVGEAIADPSALTVPRDPYDPISKILDGAILVRTTASCHTFELTWSRYVAYLVTEEGVASGNSSDEVFTGNLFRVYEKSKFLDYLSATCNPIESVMHFRLVCQNHVIDVVSYHAPDVRLLSPSVQTGEKHPRPN